jgi:hypothetical protein
MTERSETAILGILGTLDILGIYTMIANINMRAK